MRRIRIDRGKPLAEEYRGKGNGSMLLNSPIQ